MVALDTLVHCVVYHALTCGWGGAARRGGASPSLGAHGLSLAAYHAVVAELHPGTTMAVEVATAAARGPGKGSSVSEGDLLLVAAAAARSASSDPNPLLSILTSQWREGCRLMGGFLGHGSGDGRGGGPAAGERGRVDQTSLADDAEAGDEAAVRAWQHCLAGLRPPVPATSPSSLHSQVCLGAQCCVKICGQGKV